MTKFQTWYAPDIVAAPLVYVGTLPTRPILTVLNYMKWYCFYIVHPGGFVSAVGYADYASVELSAWQPPAGCDRDEYEDLAYPGSNNCHTWRDHTPNPAQLERIAAQLGAQWDEQSREMIIGRYHRELKD